MIIIERHIIGKNIKEIRKKKGLSQNELALKLYKNQSYISDLESGKSNMIVNLEALAELAKALNCNVEDFCYMKDIKQDKGGSRNERRGKFRDNFGRD